MRIKFPARYCKRYSSSIEKSELAKLVEETLEKLRWKYTLKADGEFQAQIPFNFWSFGEKINIEIQSDGISICSKCISPFQCFDWGKNQENVETFLNGFGESIDKFLSNRAVQNINSFDEKGFSPVERVFTESE